MIRTLMLSTFSGAPALSGDNQEKTEITTSTETEKTETYVRTDTTFLSKGVRCAAWLYLPENVKNPPVVIMAHGLGGERIYRLDAYAERFAQRGMACFVFDYRTFGGSDGEPRQNINPFRHLEDWEAAIAFVRNLDAVDTSRIALWGSSFSAGHVIVMATRHPDIRGIVGQAPFVDGISSSMNNSIPYIVRAGFHGTLDLIICAATLGKKRHRVKYAAEAGNFAVLNKPDCFSGIIKLIPDGIAWQDVDFKCPALIFLTLPIYRPTMYAKKVNCPALIMYSENDSLIPASAVRKTIAKLKHGKGVCFPSHVGHFDTYVGEEFEKTSKQQADFFESCFL